jgi:nucleotide-binding universal stress UspA family protein
VTAYRTVVVGTDGSDSSFRAVDRAAELAAAVGAELLIASAYQPLRGRELDEATSALGGEAYQVTGSTPAESVLREATERARKAGATAVRTQAKQADPVDLLVELSETDGVGLCVVGNRGLNSLAGRILGSVPANITHRAACDVLVVHTTSGRSR